MTQAIEQARRAATAGEVPVGCVVVLDGEIIADGFNRKEAGDPTSHAEMVAIRRAATAVGDWRLNQAMLVCTLEPCMMCLGAILQARVGTVVYGATEPKFGAIESQIRGLEAQWNHTPQIRGGVLADECAQLMRAFFRDRRGKVDNPQAAS